MKYTQASFERAVRQQVRSQPWELFAVCAPGFEPTLAKELVALGQSPDASTHGGVSWTSRLPGLASVLPALRTPNRVYLRLAEFRAGAMEELFRRVAEVPWERWLPPGATLEVKSEVERSRLNHEGESAETVAKAFRRRLSEAEVDPRWYRGEPSPCVRVLLRVTDNRASLSLDASGELHYRRGYRVAQGKAPLRESLAAGLLLRAFPDADWSRTQVYDGMCGGGTLVLEALSLVSGSMAGAGRSFAYEAWPALSAEASSNARAQALTRARPPAPGQVGGSDRDPEALSAARACADAACRVWGVPAPRFTQADFFSLDPPGLDPTAAGAQPIDHRILCLNPPYGLRLESDVRELYQAIARRARTAWRGWQLLCIVPFRELLGAFPRSAERFSFHHGGLDVWAVVVR